MQTRLASPNDLTAIAALHATSWRHTYRGILAEDYLSERVLRERMGVWRNRLHAPRPEQYVVVAEDQDGIVGFACAYGSANDRWGTMLDNLHSLPSMKGRGIGSTLISAVASWSSRHYPDAGLFLWMFEQNSAARRFYENLGGIPVEETTWIAPEGTAVRELRYTWDRLDELISLVGWGGARGS